MRHIINGLIAGGLFIAGQAMAAPADDLRDLLEQNRFFDAYQVGRSLPEHYGEPAFDLYFGISAIEAGHASEGVLALVRYRMVTPDDGQGALHLARGYLVLGETVRSRAELDVLLGTAPPPEIAAAAEALLAIVRSRESAVAGGARFYGEAGLGSDSNVNGGIDSATVTLPVFGQISLPAQARKTSDTFTHFAAGTHLSRTIKPGLSVFGGMDVSTRLLSDVNQFNQTTLGGSLGAAHNRGGTLWRVTASHHTLWLKNHRYRSVNGLAGEWSKDVGSGSMLNAFLQYARFGYGSIGADIRDADFYGIGGGYRRTFTGVWRPALNLTVTHGKERNDRNRLDLSRDIWGISGTLAATPMPRLGLWATLAYQESDFGANDPLLGTKRRDRFNSVTLGSTYLIDRHLSVRGELVHMDSRSNIPLFTYKRTHGAIKIRYDF